MKEVVSVWNAHTIRRYRNQQTPHGRPLLLYNAPEMHNTQDYKIPITEDEVECCRELCASDNDETDDFCKDIYDMASLIMEEERRDEPKSQEEAAELYLYLRNEIIIGIT